MDPPGTPDPRVIQPSDDPLCLVCGIPGTAERMAETLDWDGTRAGFAHPICLVGASPRKVLGSRSPLKRRKLLDQRWRSTKPNTCSVPTCTVTIATSNFSKCWDCSFHSCDGHHHDHPCKDFALLPAFKGPSPCLSASPTMTSRVVYLSGELTSCSSGSAKPVNTKDFEDRFDVNLRMIHEDSWDVSCPACRSNVIGLDFAIIHAVEQCPYASTPTSASV